MRWEVLIGVVSFRTSPRVAAYREEIRRHVFHEEVGLQLPVGKKMPVMFATQSPTLLRTMTMLEKQGNICPA